MTLTNLQKLWIIVFALGLFFGWALTDLLEVMKP